MADSSANKSLATSIRECLFSRRTLCFIGCLAIIAVISFAFFFPDAYEGRSLRQHDMQQGIAIGQEAKAFAEQTGETTRWTNSLFSGMPTFQISPSYPSSKLIGWINTLMGLGLPSPAQLAAMMMTGFLILMFVMRMRWPVALLASVAYGFSTYFIIIIGAGHIWKFLTLAYVPPTIAGIILCYRGRYLAGGALAALFAMMQIAQNHVQMTYYFLFVIIGVVIAALLSAWRHKQLKQWGIATATLIGAAVLAVTANLPSLYNTYEYSKETMRGRHTELTAGNAAAAAGQGLDKNYITQYSYQPSETFSLLIPNIKGGASAAPVKGQMVAKNLASLPDASQYGETEQSYLEYMSQYFGDPEGTNGPVYVGAMIFAMAVMSVIILRRKALTWVLAGLTLFSICLAWGRHAMTFTDIMLAAVPMYGKFRTVESILVIAEFTLPLLAALGLQAIFSTPAAERKQLLKPLYWSFGACAAICAAAFLFPEMFGSLISENDRVIDEYITQALVSRGMSASDVYRMYSLNNPEIYNAVVSLRAGLVSGDALRSLAIIAIGGALLWLYIKQKVGYGLTLGALGVLTLIDLYTVNKRYLNHDSFTSAPRLSEAPIVKTQADIIILRDTVMNYRVMDIPRFQSADPSYYHKMIGGYHAAKLTRYQDLIDRHLSHFLNGSQTDADWNVLNMLNARYVVDFEGQPIQNPEAQGNAWFIDEITYVDTPDQEMAGLSTTDLRTAAVADRKFADILGQAAPKAETDTIFETTYAPNRLTYHTERQTDGIAVLSEVYFPWGWKATVDGQPVEIGRVNYVLRGIRVPAGSHTVELTFDPQSLHTTDAAATVAIILIYMALIAAAVTGVIRCRREKIATPLTENGESH